MPDELVASTIATPAPPTISFGRAGSLTWHYLHDQTTKEIFSGGSAGPGKTFTGCAFAMEQCLRYPGISVGIFRQTAEDLRKSAVETMFRVVEKTEGQIVEGKHFRFISNKGIWQWYTGSTCIFDYLNYQPGDPDYRRLGGREFTHAFVDEGDQIEERAVSMLAGRLRLKNTEFCHACAATHMAKRSVAVDCDDDGNPIMWECYKCGTWTKGVVPKMLVTGNPGPFWTRDRYICDSDGVPVELPPQRKAVTMLLKDNPDKAHVASYGQQLLDSTDDDYDIERLIKGNWMAVRKTGREFMYAFSQSKHVPRGKDRVAYDPSLPLHITWDFNTAPYITLLVAQIRLNTDNRFHVAFLREFCLKHPESNPTAACGALLHAMEPAGAFPDHKAGIFYYGDASGKNSDLNQRDGIRHSFDTIRKELRTHLHNSSDRVIFRNPSHAVVRDFQNSAFKGDRRFYMSFDPSMTNTIADHLNVKEGADGKILKVYETDRTTGVRYEKWGHCVQATYYMTCGAFPDEFKTFIRR